MQDEKKLDSVLEVFYNRYNKFNTKVLEELGNVIKQFDGITPSEAHVISQELKLGFDLDKLLNELSIISGKSVKDISDLFDKVAEENVEFAESYYKARNKEFIDYENNQQLQDIVNAIKKQTDATFINIANSNNIGFTIKENDGTTSFKPIRQIYNDLIDEAVYNVTTGVKDYQSAMRNTINQLASSGVKVHQEKLGYESGYNRRIDSSVRQDVLTGLRQVNIDIQRQVGEDFGADGVEISAHSPCAMDHLDIQGMQYSDEEFEKLNSELDRPIGTYNCRHFIFSIILGVNLPSYSKKQLAQYRKESLGKVTYNGKTYTKYEATQVQRKLETSIRKQKDIQIMAKASGNYQLVGQAQQKITQLTEEYNKFSNKAGLDTYVNRLSVSGYKKMDVSWYKADKVIKAGNEILKNVPNYGKISNVVPEGVVMENVRVIAGYNTSTPLKKVDMLTNKYPNNPQIWQKKVGTVKGEYNEYEIHWFANGGEQFMVKIKKVK